MIRYLEGGIIEIELPGNELPAWFPESVRVLMDQERRSTREKLLTLLREMFPCS